MSSRGSRSRRLFGFLDCAMADGMGVWWQIIILAQLLCFDDHDLSIQPYKEKTAMATTSFSPHRAPSGFLLPSIHSAPPFFTQQPNPTTQATLTGQWTKLILSYARHRNLFVLRIDDAETSGNDWDEILRNERINRKLLPSHLSVILADMVSKNLAVYEPVRQTRSVLLYWKTPEEWAETLHGWADSTGQLNSILTFYDIIEPPVPSPLTGLPLTILRKAIAILAKTSRAQTIAVADGEGVRFLAGNTSR
ncbi:ESCRT-II complex subunit-domain-containing protein [Irpex lacteus]|nr:ESCRT-II complex subunit-domain-containing protein [Irpex lacteus]